MTVAGCVAKSQRKKRQHGFQHARIKRSGGVIIQVERKLDCAGCEAVVAHDWILLKMANRLPRMRKGCWAGQQPDRILLEQLNDRCKQKSVCFHYGFEPV